VCPTDALYLPDDLDEFGLLKHQFSCPRKTHPSTQVLGRGTEEIKTNDVTGRFKRGFCGIAIEMGRPGIGTTFKDVDKISQVCGKHGAQFEDANPVTTIYEDKKLGKIYQKYHHVRVLSAIIEFVMPNEHVVKLLMDLKEAAKTIDTVFSLDICGRAEKDGTFPIDALVKEAGITPYPNGKSNMGLGRPYYTE
jgi:hypothetical protein